MITNIKLDNFKCFKHVGFRLSNLTILTGANGAGKSSIVQSLLMLRQSYEAKGSELRNTILYKGDLTDLDSSNEVLSFSSEEKNIRIELLDNKLDAPFFVNVPDADKNVKNCEVSDNYDEAIKKISLFNDDFVYLYANRLSPASHYTPSIDPSSTASRLGDKTGNETAFRISDALANNERLHIEGLRINEANSDLVSENISKWLSYIMDNETVISVDGSREDKDAKINFLQGKDIMTKNMSPLQAAFGFTYILPIVTAVITASKGSLIIIENPEAHLHPKAQLRIGEFLAKAADNDVQIIVETHSDHFVNGSRIAVKNGMDPSKMAIHFFAIDKDKPFEHYDTPINVDKDGTIDDWPEGFFDEWEKALMVINS